MDVAEILVKFGTNEEEFKKQLDNAKNAVSDFGGALSSSRNTAM